MASYFILAGKIVAVFLLVCLLIHVFFLIIAGDERQQ